MSHHPAYDMRLFPTPVSLIHAHFSWHPAAGWNVYVSHHHEGQKDDHQCDADHYDRLSYDEASQVLDATVHELLPWTGSSWSATGSGAAGS
jgi:hypothetical protein